MDLERVDRITAGAVGEPGERTFFLQAREGDRSSRCSREGAGGAAGDVDPRDPRQRRTETGEGPPSDELGLEPPLEPLWRAGRLSIGYAEERDLMVLEIEELVEEDEHEDEDRGRAEGEGWPGRGPRARAHPAVGHPGADARAGPPRSRGRGAGRPQCGYCGNPIDPEGHTCPAMNGHRESAGR